MYTVEDIMSPVVLTVPHNKLVCEVEGILVSEKISGAPLVDLAGNVVGLISKSDIVHFDFIGGDTYTTPANEICSVNIIIIDSTDSVMLAAKMMMQHHVHRLLVVHGGKMIGIIAESDIVKLVSEKDVGL